MSQQLITWILDYSRHLTAVITVNEQFLSTGSYYISMSFIIKIICIVQGTSSCFLVSYACLGAVQTILYNAKYEQEMQVSPNLQVSICLKWYGYQGHIVAGSWIGISKKRFVTFLRFEINPFKKGPKCRKSLQQFSCTAEGSRELEGVFHHLTECRPIIQVLFIDFVWQN